MLSLKRSARTSVGCPCQKSIGSTTAYSAPACAGLIMRVSRVNNCVMSLQGSFAARNELKETRVLSSRRRSISKGVHICASIILCILLCFGVSYASDWCDRIATWLSSRIAVCFHPLLADKGWIQMQGVYATDLFRGLYTSFIAGLGAIIGVSIFVLLSRLSRGALDGHTHCGCCGYILKGLSEPRCPECGERI